MDAQTRKFGWRLAGVCLGLAALFLALTFTSHADAAGCFAKPSSCGYPDATNTGVPAGTTLTPSSTRTISTAGTVINGAEFTGAVTIAASNVTIKNSRIATTNGGSGSYGLIINNGASNFTIEHSEIVGPAGESNGLESAVWNHYGNPGVVARSDYFHHCADCWEGPGTFENDYMVVDAGYSGSHNEDIYVCGGAVKVEHSTLLNSYHQTATVFGDTAGCGGNTFEVTNSLLAGGGYLVYPQANATAATGTMNVSGNRFARCLNGTAYDSSSGGTYCNGKVADGNGYYPYGGFYGVAAYFFGGAGNVWTNNVWDDSGKPVCADGDEGCGTTTPPPVSEPPVESPKEGETGNESPKGESPLEAILSLPDEILVNVPVLLDGSDSTGPQGLTCTWSIHTPSGTDGLSGCLTTYRFPDLGSSSVKLTVHSSQASDSTRTTVTVLPAAPATESAVNPPGSGNGIAEETTVPSLLQSGSTAPAASVAPAAAVIANGGARTLGTSLARQAWKAPAKLRPRSRTKLTADVTEKGATCTWTIRKRGAHSRSTQLAGCSVALRAPAGGKLSVQLAVRAADGALSTVRRTVRVA